MATQKDYTVEPVDPNCIPSNEQGQPQVLWVGCSSSWVTETEALNVHRDEIFVHRNLGNILSYSDLSSESALEYALDLLQVKHIIICGHYDCRLQKNEFMDGIHTMSNFHAFRDPTRGSEAKNFPMKTVSELKRTPESERLEESHVLREVRWVKKHPLVAKAMEERGVEVHGFIYDKESGRCSRLVEVGSA